MRTLRVTGLNQTGTQTIWVVPRGEDRTETVTKFLDVRLSKRFTFGVSRFEATFDVFNVLNANHVLEQNEALGTTFPPVANPHAAHHQIRRDTRLLALSRIRDSVEVGSRDQASRNLLMCNECMARIPKGRRLSADLYGQRVAGTGLSGQPRRPRPSPRLSPRSRDE